MNSGRDDEIREELGFHLEAEQEEREAAGLPPDQARLAAKRDLGNPTLLAEKLRGTRHLETLLQDVRYGLRGMRKDPIFTFAALLCLTLGIGANTAVFSTVNAYLLRSLPYRDPDQLTAVYEQRPRESQERGVVSYADFLDWREQNRSFAAMCGYEPGTFNYNGAGEPQRVRGAVVTTNFFDVLQVRSWRGATFGAKEDTPGADGILVSHGFWQRFLGSDTSAVGRAIAIDGRPHRVIGILPADFVPPFRGWDIYFPLQFDAAARGNRGNHSLVALGRLKPGTTLPAARADLAAISKRLEAAFPVNKGHYASVVPLYDALRDELRPAMLILLVTVGLVLLIACFNVANLLLARSVVRAREIALRLSLGGSRLRVVRQLLTESLVLSLSGAALGVAAAFGGVSYLRSILPASSNLGPEDLRVDLPVLAFTSAIAVLCGILFGLAPALTATGGSLSKWIRFAGRGQTESVWHRRQRSLILVLQTGVAVLLLIGGGLLMRSFWKLEAVNPGFRPEKLLTMQMTLPAGYREDARKIAFQHDLIQRVRALPGVTSAGFTSFLPFADQNSRMGFVIEGIEPPPNEPRRANWRLATPGYVETMRIPLLRGRLFQESDRQGAPLVMLVNETAAKKYWLGRDPVGSHARLVRMDSFATVIGVIGDVKHWGLEESARPEAYLSSYQTPFAGMNLVVRTGSEPESLIGAVRAQLRAIDPSIPALATNTMEISSRRRMLHADSSQSLLPDSRCSRCCSPPAARSRRWRTPSRSARRKSASGWRSAQAAQALWR